MSGEAKTIEQQLPDKLRLHCENLADITTEIGVDFTPLVADLGMAATEIERLTELVDGKLLEDRDYLLAQTIRSRAALREIASWPDGCSAPEAWAMARAAHEALEDTPSLKIHRAVGRNLSKEVCAVCGVQPGDWHTEPPAEQLLGRGG